MLAMCRGLPLYYLNFRIKLLQINWLWSRTIAVVFLIDNMTLKLPVYRSCSENMHYLLSFTFSIQFCICQRLCCSLCVCATLLIDSVHLQLDTQIFFSITLTHAGVHTEMHARFRCVQTKFLKTGSKWGCLKNARVLSNQQSGSQSISSIWEATLLYGRVQEGALRWRISTRNSSVGQMTGPSTLLPWAGSACSWMHPCNLKLTTVLIWIALEGLLRRRAGSSPCPRGCVTEWTIWLGLFEQRWGGETGWQACCCLPCRFVHLLKRKQEVTFYWRLGWWSRWLKKGGGWFFGIWPSARQVVVGWAASPTTFSSSRVCVIPSTSVMRTD